MQTDLHLEITDMVRLLARTTACLSVLLMAGCNLDSPRSTPPASLTIGAPEVLGNRLSIAGDASNTEIVVVDSPAHQTTDLQTWRVGGRVVADITSTGSIELNSITFGIGRGAVIAETTGGAFYFQSDLENGNGNFVFDAPSPGQYFFQTDAQTRFQITQNGSIITTKPCAPGFERLSTNFCTFDGMADQTMLGSACSWLTVPAQDATAVVYEFESTLRSAGSVGYRSISTRVFSGANCELLADEIDAGTMEFTPVVGSQTLLRTTSSTVVRTRGAAVTGFAAPSGPYDLVGYRVTGYYD